MKQNSNQRLKRCLGVIFLTMINTGTLIQSLIITIIQSFVYKPFADIQIK